MTHQLWHRCGSRGIRRSVIALVFPVLGATTVAWALGIAWRLGPCLTPLAAVSSGAYAFHASRAVIHLCNVPEPGTPLKNGIQTKGLPPEVKPVGVFGRTLGGAFFINWDRSPWGPFLEVGLLSGLVAASSAATWAAWASNVFVDSAEAADDGRTVWGLPTSRCQIDVQEANVNGNVIAFGQAPLMHFGDGLGPLGRVDSPAKIIIGALPWAEAAPLVTADETAWSRQLREDRALRGEPALASNTADSGGMSQQSRRNEPSLPWPLPQELVVSNLSGCLPPQRTSYRENTTAQDNNSQRLLTYSLRLKLRTGRTLPGRRPTGGSGIVPRVDFSDWQPLIGYEFLDIDAEVGMPEAL